MSEDKSPKQTVFTDEEKQEQANSTDEGGKTSSGLEQNIAGFICYLFGFVTGIIFLVIEKENKFVRFHAMQSIVLFVSLFILSLIFTIIPFIGWVFSLLLVPVSFILWILMMFKAYNGEKYKLPYVGDFAEKQVENMNS